jgi:hypothetical protein
MQVMARGAAKYPACTLDLVKHALPAMRTEINANMIVAQRGRLLQQVLAAFIVCGKQQFVSQLLEVEKFLPHLEDQGASSVAMLANSIIDASRIEGPELAAGQLKVEAVQPVWDTMFKVGADMNMAASSRGESEQSTCALLCDAP